MCDACWNAKVFADKVLKNGLCTGQEMAVFDMDGLKMAIKEEWLEHNKSESDYYVFRKALSTPPKTLSMLFDMGGQDRVRVHFV